ncbi:hypothetical protein QAD02_004052 [Eretmocerus hayati]|uniref:Uncharacterized protein n=1 Tax=Eretmocerus hayati TaxID=131215 RepID=A0ACC2NRD5_9HYME|nr:hypothetical protein QAD02_004052 [Eretmocerus hayati]
MKPLGHLIVVGILVQATVNIYGDSYPCYESHNYNGFCLRQSHPSKDSFEIEIECMRNKNPSWDNFPSGIFSDSTIVNKMIFKYCDFPQNLSLFEKVQALGFKRTNSLAFEESETMLNKENLRNFSLTRLFLDNMNFNELPFDLIHEVHSRYLTINGLGLKGIPQDFFAKANHLETLGIYHNKINISIKKNDFKGLANLSQLFLVNNNIFDIELGAFDPLSNLQVLDLSRNQLHTLPNGIFRSLSSLRAVSLTLNHFSSLPENLFQPANLTLKSVRLSYNVGELSELPKGFFKGLIQLDSVEMTDDNISSIPEDTFAGAKALNTLNLSHNRLTMIPANIFKDTRQLEILKLSDNRLMDLPHNSFANSQLKELYLNNNRLSYLSKEYFGGLGYLVRLEISSNKIASIDPGFCNALPNLKYLDLSRNELSSEKAMESEFTNCAFLAEANLSFNNLTEISALWMTKGYLVNLNFEGNKISEVNEITFDILKTNMTLNLRRNNISRVNISEVKNIFESHRKISKEDKNSKILLGGNHLDCDCHVSLLMQYLNGKFDKTVYADVNISVEDLKCSSPIELRGKLITDITRDDENDLRCPRLSSIPEDPCNSTCECWDYPARDVMLYVDCSNRNLTGKALEKIDNPQNYLINLTLSGTGLTEIPSGLNVTFLDLSNNSITAVSKQVFSPTLRDLKLHNNSISRFDPDVVQYLDDYGSQNPPHIKVTLYDNKWICDCKMRDFLNVYKRNFMSYQIPHKVYCHNRNGTLDDLTSDELCKYWLHGVVTFLILLAMFMFGMTVFVTVYFKNQEKIKIWLYSKKLCLWWVTEYELDKDKLYDAFVSFSHLDEDFVENVLVPKLEEGPHSYSLCLHQRDWLVGEYIPDQINTSVQESRRTIVVLSPNFLESHWGKLEIRAAHDQALREGRVRLIVIIYGDINIQKLDDDLKNYLSMNTYLKWGDPWFWDRLRFAMPHRTEPRRKKTRKAPFIEDHLAQIPLNNHCSGNESDTIALPKITNASSNDSAKLLDSTLEEVRA